MWLYVMCVNVLSSSVTRINLLYYRNGIERYRLGIGIVSDPDTVETQPK